MIFRVKDTGIGIEEERLPYIFNLFEKDENSNLNDYLNLNTKCKYFIHLINLGYSCENGPPDKSKLMPAHGRDDQSTI